MEIWQHHTANTYSEHLFSSSVIFIWRREQTKYIDKDEENKTEMQEKRQMNT